MGLPPIYSRRKRQAETTASDVYIAIRNRFTSSNRSLPSECLRALTSMENRLQSVPAEDQADRLQILSAGGAPHPRALGNVSHPW
jgi:hypothetical protein